MVTSVTKRRYGAERGVVVGLRPLTPGRDGWGSVGSRVSKMLGVRGLYVPNAVEV